MKMGIISKLTGTVFTAGAVVGLGLAGMSSASAATVRPNSVPPGYDLMKNYHSGKCLNVNGASQDTGAVITNINCNPSNHAQAWQFNYIDGLGYQIKNYHSGKCLTINANSTDSGAILIQASCSSRHAWLWTAHAGDVGTLFKNYHTGKCMAVNNNSQESGAYIVQEPCVRNYHAEQWYSVTS